MEPSPSPTRCLILMGHFIFGIYTGPSAHTCTRPVEETGSSSRSTVRVCSSLFSPITHRKAPVGTWNEDATPHRFPLLSLFFSYLCTTSPINRPVEGAIGFPFPSHTLHPPPCPCIITLILICCHSSVPLPLLPGSHTQKVIVECPFTLACVPRYPDSALYPTPFRFFFFFPQPIFSPHLILKESTQ